ncbi:hypothetical protein HYY70_06140 [Candidatus Woesearchaeota archaeon]|nr:hypothetical protein [Candidatus Woesearchaeota archaeon]
MTWIFEVKDKSGRKIHLSDERWKHLNQEHPEVAPYLEDIKETLKNPVKITEYELDENVKYYYKYFKERESAKYLLVIVKYLNEHGFIITAYFVRNIK